MADDSYRELIELNQSVFEGGNYDAAYHILMAAMHCATGDRKALEEVRALAMKELTTIDAEHAEYDHSSASARKRGHLSIYEMLAEQARAMAAMAKTEKIAERGEKARSRR